MFLLEWMEGMLHNVDTSVLIGYSNGEYIGQGNTDAQRVVKCWI